VLAETIWESGRTPEKAMSNMRNAIYVLRKMFGKDFIVESSVGFISVSPKAKTESDAALFLSGEADAASMRSAELLEDFYLKDNNMYNEWLDAKRQSMRELFTERLRAEIPRAFDDGDFPHAEKLCRKLYEADDFDETSYRYLIKIYGREGEYAKALSVYDDLEKLYERELNERPGKETEALVEELRAELRRGTERDESVRNGAFFFGRESEVESIEAELRSFFAGAGCRCAAIRGEGGIGKTALAERVLSGSAAQGGIVLKSECFRAEERYALKPWKKIISVLLSQEGGSGFEWLEMALSTIFPFTGKRGKRRGDADLRAEDAAAELILRAASRKRLVIFFDDVQWADEATLSLIQRVMTSDRCRTVCFILTYKGEAAGRAAAEQFAESMKRAGLLKYITLARFGRDETISMAKRLLPGVDFTDEFADRFCAETDGNPFFIVETANNIKFNGELGGITPNMRDVIKDRISFLPRDCARLLEFISIFFEGADFDTLLSVSKSDALELAEKSELLIKRRFIREEEYGGEIVLRFTHQKIREYIYGRMSLAKRRILHERAGAAYERAIKSPDADFEICPKLIHHFGRAGNLKKELKYKVKYLNLYFGAVHEYFPVSGGGMGREDIDGAMHSGGLRGAIAEAERLFAELKLESGAQDAETREIISDYCHLLGRYRILLCDYGAGMDYIERMKEMNAAASTPEEANSLIKADRQMLYIHINRCEPAKMLQVADRVLSLLQGRGDEETIGVWHRMRGMALVMSGETEKAVRELEEAVRVFESCGDTKYQYNLAAATAWLGEAERHKFRYEEADLLYKKALAVMKSFRWVGGGATFYTYAGIAAYDGGSFERAEEYLNEAVNSYDAVTLLWARGLARAYSALLSIRRRDFAEAESNLKLAEANAKKLDSRYEMGVINRVRAEIRAAMDNDAELRAEMSDLLDESAETYASRAEMYLEGIYSPIDRVKLREIRERTAPD
jgi:pentatricopeptide repeat protein